MTVSDYNTYQSHSNYTSWDWNLNEMHVLFIHIWMTVSDYTTNNYSFYFWMTVSVSDNTNPTVIILVGIGILSKCMF